MKNIVLPVFLSLCTLTACHQGTRQAQAGNSSNSAAPDPAVLSNTPPASLTAYGAERLLSGNPAATHTFDLLHTKLEVRFDWAQARMPGKAWLKLKPWFYASQTLELDAKGFDITQVALVKGGIKSDLKYTYDGLKLRITLDREYKKGEEFEIFVDYVSKPNELKAKGSAAITDAKGLYFINPDGKEAGKPQQVWTQGETEANSAWFPTIDKPNERCTEEIYITVDDRFTTLSNGKLVSSTRNPDGTRTDYWKQSLPHAPYLFMMAVGEFAVVKDTWRGIEVNYYVEKKYEPYAKLVFGYTPEMLECFSTRLGVDYPWEKYSQVVVRDFVSGAMENTTAVIHFGALQHDSRSHLDEPYEDIIAHEMFHHWFGDLVTCESWANLTLNEGFATYGEYIWNEYKYGADQAGMVLEEKQSAYLMEAQNRQVDLIRYDYEDKEDMFDSHSYAKGGCILHMLRKEVGDEAFFASLKHYLNRNAYTEVEVDELRMAFEEVTGRDLHWFFNQWFLASGHPELELTIEKTETAVKMRVQQLQNRNETPLYRLPLQVSLLKNGKHDLRTVWLEGGDSTFVFPVNGAPDVVIFNPEKTLLCTVKGNKKTRTEAVAMLNAAQNYAQKSEALRTLQTSADDEAACTALMQAAADPFWYVRERALDILVNHNGSHAPELMRMAAESMRKDEKASVRGSAVLLGAALAQRPGADAAARSQVVTALGTAVNDSSYRVESSALRSLYDLEPQKALSIAQAREAKASSSLGSTLAELYLKAKDPGAVDFIVAQYQKTEDSFGKLGLVNKLGPALPGLDAANQEKGLKLLMEVIGGSAPWWARMSASNHLKPFTSRQDVRDFLTAQAQKEAHPALKAQLEKLLK